jgi:hypothetical protein
LGGERDGHIAENATEVPVLKCKAGHLEFGGVGPVKRLMDVDRS